MTSSLLVFTTDFGLSDSYAGVMKGVALGINPDLSFVDLTHQIAPQNVFQGSFALGVSYRYFPPDTIHVAVVDPGVGTSRRPVLLQTPQGSFVAPDNGLLSRVLDNYLPSASVASGPIGVPQSIKAFHLTNPAYWLHPVSSTFHGRDIFTPAAAHLSLGVAPDQMGELTDVLEYLPVPGSREDTEGIRGEIIYIDTYGNLISNIPLQLIEGRAIDEIRIKGRSIAHLSLTFNDGPAAGLVALVGSHGYLEVAVPNGSAAATLSAGPGEPIGVTFAVG